MRIIISCVFIVLLTGCSGPDFKLDYTEIEINYLQPGYEPDSLSDFPGMAEQIFRLQEESALHVHTDKNVYAVGEEITLLIENKSAIPFFFYPGEAEAGRFLLFKPDPALFEDFLVCSDPAIGGEIREDDHESFIVTIQAFPRRLTEQMGYTAAELAVQPGESLQLNVTLPPVAGTFRFFLMKFDHDPNSMRTWGANRTVFSNSFVVG